MPDPVGDRPPEQRVVLMKSATGKESRRPPRSFAGTGRRIKPRGESAETWRAAPGPTSFIGRVISTRCSRWTVAAARRRTMVCRRRGTPRSRCRPSPVRQPGPGSRSTCPCRKTSRAPAAPRPTVPRGAFASICGFATCTAIVSVRCPGRRHRQTEPAGVCRPAMLLVEDDLPGPADLRNVLQFEDRGMRLPTSG